MKKMVTASLVAAMALTSVNASALENRLSDLETELADVKKKLKKQNKKINKIKAHDAGDNIKWGVDLRTGIDNINYEMADGSEAGNDHLMTLRLWLNMEFAPDENNVFKGQLSMNKAFGGDFSVSPLGNRGHSFGSLFDWVGNEALTDNSLKVRQAYWLYLGDELFGAEIPWTFSLGRRPSVGGFIANLREDDAANSPLGHLINVEFDGLSTKADLSTVTGIQGMSFKICMGKGSTNAQPILSATPYASSSQGDLEDIDLAGFIFEPYNDGQFIVKTTGYRAFNLPDLINPFQPQLGFATVGDIDGAGISVLIDGLTEDGFLSDTKLFGSFAWTETNPDAGNAMLGSVESESGTSYWVGAQLPVGEDGVLGLEYNHGSQYWRPFTYAEDTMSGSKVATRGDAYEGYFTYQLTEALSAQIRYTRIENEYTGSQGFFGSSTGTSISIEDVKSGASTWDQMSGGADPRDPAAVGAVAGIVGQDAAIQLATAAAFAPNVVEVAEDFRFYIRYRF